MQFFCNDHKSIEVPQFHLNVFQVLIVYEKVLDSEMTVPMIEANRLRLQAFLLVTGLYGLHRPSLKKIHFISGAENTLLEAEASFSSCQKLYKIQQIGVIGWSSEVHLKPRT